jgi:hypothetical protein
LEPGDVPGVVSAGQIAILRLPIWLVMGWWFIKGAARLVYLACRYWYVTGPTLVLLWLADCCGDGAGRGLLG